jgi:outer membrane protein assembly factor BamB
MKKLTFLTLSVVMATAARAEEPAQDPLHNWPHWRGPLANGVAPFANPPTRWDDKTNLKWKVAIPGRGSATPIIWGDRVFVVTAIRTDRVADPAALPQSDPRYTKRTQPPKNYFQFVVLCLDRHTGKTIWRHIAAEQVPHEGHHDSHSYAAASPTTDGRFLYVSFGSRGIFCYNLDGTLQWQRDLGRMQTRLGWGEGISPVIHGDTLIMNWDHEAGSFLVALDSRTGKTKWKVDRDEPTSWSTPLIVPHRDRTQVIVSATNKVRSYDLATGQLIWECGGQTTNVISCPVLIGDTVVCMSGYRKYIACAISLDSTGDVTDSPRVVWRYEKGTPYVPSPLLYGDKLYFTQANMALLTCIDARTGKALFEQERLPGLDSLYASPSGAADRIYINGRDGTTLVLKRGDKLEVLATNRLGDPMDASPAIVGKQLFLRGREYLYCLEDK